jgi:alpha-1,3-rhamnosyl/mannosyltransferase
MRVVVNELAALGRKTGIGHYTVELLRCLRRQAVDDHIDAFPHGWLRRGKLLYSGARHRGHPPSQHTGGDHREPRSLPAALRSWVLDRLRDWGRSAAAWSFQAFCRRQRCQVYHEPNYIPLPSSLPTVATVCDLSVLLHPQWHPADRVAYFERHFQRSLTNCAHVIAISEFCRQEIIRFLGVPSERVTRTYLGTRPGLRPLPREQAASVLDQLGLPPEYLLYLGTLEPRKNLLTLLRAYCRLPLPLRERFPLVLVGSWGWKAGAIADFLQRTGSSRGVLHLGYVPEQHLAALYNGARALVYPSLYEGFGLPPVEMLACGGAVLASTAGALTETVGGQAHLIAPDDEDGWCEGMERVLDDDDWWQWLRQGAVEAARPFTWERCAAETLNVYRTVAGEPVQNEAPPRDSRCVA